MDGGTVEKANSILDYFFKGIRFINMLFSIKYDIHVAKLILYSRCGYYYYHLVFAKSL